MRFIDYFLIALRNIWRAKLRSALTIFAVVIGAMSVTIMLALVTGATGFLGRRLVTALLSQGHHVIAYRRPSAAAYELDGLTW